MKSEMAICHECNYIFRFGKMIPSASDSDEMGRPQPQNVNVKHDMGQHIIEWRWRVDNLIIIAIMAAVFGGFTLLVYVAAVFDAISNNDWGAFLPTFIYLPITLLACFFVYYLLVHLFNKTQVVLDHANLQVKYGPIPVFGGCTLDRHDIVQFFVKTVRFKKTRHYDLYVMLADGTQRRILSEKTTINSEIVLFVAQELEAAMGIEDAYVRGEYIGEESFPSLREVVDIYKELRAEKKQTD